MNDEYRIDTHDQGYFVQLNDGIVIFSRDEPRPLLPWRCPACGQGTINYEHNMYLVRYGMCSACSSYWNDVPKLRSDLEFYNRLLQFENWIKNKTGENYYG